MKVRTLDQFLRISGDDRIWRIKEMTVLSSVSTSSDQSSVKRDAIRRSMVPIAYAHWEGYVKRIGQAYLDFVAAQGLRLAELTPCFQSIYFTSENANDLRKMKRHSLHAVLSRLESGINDRVHIKTKEVISTQGNLNSEVLGDICLNLGLNISGFVSLLPFIDKILLGKRNGIAHGEASVISEADAEDIRTKVVACIDEFKVQIENAAVNEAYKRKQIIAE